MSNMIIPPTNFRWARVTVSDELLQALFPGAVTAVFERRPSLHPHLNPGNPLVGVRIPDHGFVRALVSHCGHPLALTSANVSDTRSTLAVEVSPSTVTDVLLWLQR